MTETESYNHGYNGTLKLEELREQLSQSNLIEFGEERSIAAWQSGRQDAALDTEGEIEMDADAFMSDAGCYEECYA
mgnify:CR=1 FL=1|jgi:hypothetical protein